MSETQVVFVVTRTDIDYGEEQILGIYSTFSKAYLSIRKEVKDKYDTDDKVVLRPVEADWEDTIDEENIFEAWDTIGDSAIDSIDYVITEVIVQ